MARSSSCGICGSTRVVLESPSGFAASVCLLCDWVVCHKCGTPVPPRDIACPQCACVTRAHDPRTLDPRGGM